jgi:two-component system response regulator VicR
MHRILVVDDEVQVCKSLKRLLRAEYEVETATSGEEGLQLLDGYRPDVVISDFRMPGMNGAAFLAEVRRRAPSSLRFILSGYADLDSVLASVNEGEICHFLRKPWDQAELLGLLRRMIASRELLATLYQPFRAPREGLAAAGEVQSSKVLVRAQLSGAPMPVEDAMAIVRKFASAVQESELELVGGLLEHHGGSISFVAQVGGDQKLTLELPIAAELILGKAS